MAGINVLTLRGPILTDVIKGLALAIRADKKPNIVFFAATEDAGRPTLTVVVSDDLVKAGLNAGKMVREAAKHIQGGGGGQPGMAQAGGRNVEGLPAALDALIAQLG